MSRILGVRARTRLSLLALSIASLTLCHEASGQTESERALSEALYQDGHALLVAGDYAAACPKLAESHRLAPGVGVLLQLGTCLEKSGKLASAWAVFAEAGDRAHAAHDADRESLARRKATELEPHLSRLRVDLGPLPAGIEPSAIHVTRDGSDIPLAALGVALPVDTGAHTIEARAEGMQPFATEVVTEEAATQRVEVTYVPKPVAPHVEAPRAAVPSAPAASSSDTRAIVKWSALAVGATGLVVGVTTGAIALRMMSDARTRCSGQTHDCPTASLDLQNAAQTPATISTIGFGVGAAGIALATVLWLTTPRAPRIAIAGTPTAPSLTVFGAF